MYKHFILCTIAIFTILPVLAQTNTFQKTYGGPGDEEAYSVQQTSDGGYILAGYTKSYGPGNFENAYLIRTDSMGDLVWSKTYGVSGGASKFRSVLPTSDGGFIAAGWIYESPAKAHDILIVKTDGAGNEMWTRKFGGAGCDSAFSINLDDDGGYLISGSTSVSVADYPVPFILKINNTGTVILFKSYDLTAFRGVGSFRTSDGGLFLLGSFPSTVAPFLFSLNNSGSYEWTKSFYIHNGSAGSPSNHVDPPSCAIIQTNDSGYLYCGPGSAWGGADIGLFKLDDTGGVVWAKAYGNTLDEYGYSISKTNDGGFIVAGLSYSFSLGDRDFYLFKVDSLGNVQWSRGYGGSGEDFLYSMSNTDDGGFVLAGSSFSYGNGKQIYLVKTDVDGLSGCNDKNAITKESSGTINSGDGLLWPIQTLSNDSSAIITITSETESDSTHCSSLSVEKIAERRELKVYPNPAHSHINLELDRTDIEFIEVSLSDQTGRVVATLFKEAYNAYTGQLSLPEVAPGLYLLTVRTDDQKPRQFKLIIQ